MAADRVGDAVDQQFGEEAAQVFLRCVDGEVGAGAEAFEIGEQGAVERDLAGQRQRGHSLAIEAGEGLCLVEIERPDAAAFHFGDKDFEGFPALFTFGAEAGGADGGDVGWRVHIISRALIMR